MLQAVTFDFWGTLYQVASARDERLHLLEEVLVHHTQPRPWADLEAAYRHAWSVLDHVWLEEYRPTTVERWLREMLAFLQADLPEDVLVGLRRPMEEIYLQRYRLGLISDVGLTPGRVLRQILRRDGLLSCFRALTFSDETGATKPLPGQFLRTLAVLGARPEEAAHIGDLPETDLAGARAVGMKAVLFLGISRQEGRPLADAVFEEYGELEDLLGKLSRTVENAATQSSRAILSSYRFYSRQG